MRGISLRLWYLKTKCQNCEIMIFQVMSIIINFQLLTVHDLSNFLYNFFGPLHFAACVRKIALYASTVKRV